MTDSSLMIAEAVQDDVFCSTASVPIQRVSTFLLAEPDSTRHNETIERAGHRVQLEDKYVSLQQQSPINLHDPIITDFGKSGLEIHLKKSAVGHVKKDEHGVQVVFGADERQFVKLNGRKYHLVQFHFHHPSEHWINGKQQTMELHIVHQNIDDGTRVVLGIFIDATNEQVGVPEMVAQIKASTADPTRKHGEPEAMNPLPFLPTDTANYYRYEGSLTTPEYDENVSWVVFKEPLLLPKKEVVELIKIFQHPARLPQPLCRRFVLANFNP